MSDKKLNGSTEKERKFLHDLSNHIVVAHGMATLVQRSIRTNPGVDIKEIERL